MREENRLNKSEWRRFFKRKILSLPQKARQKSDKAACSFLNDIIKDDLKFVASYSPLPDELDISDFNSKLILLRKLVLPKTEGNLLKFYWVEDLNHLTRSKLGHFEPITPHSRAVKKEDISIIIVPGLGYDDQNTRLGRGGGFYDRFLSSAPLIKTISVAYSCQKAPTCLPKESFDVPIGEIFYF